MTTKGRGRVSRSPQNRGARRSVGWTSSTLFNGTVGDGSQSVVDGLGGLTVAEKRDVRTILRTIGTLYVRATSAGSLVTGRFGLIKVTDDAMAAGVLPDPVGDTESSWLYNTMYRQEDAANVPVRYDFDLKGRRRLMGDGQTIGIIIESSTTSVGEATYSFGIRFLYSMN